MRRNGDTFLAFHTFHSEDDRDADQAQDSDVAQVVHVGVDGGLHVETVGDLRQIFEPRHVRPDMIESRSSVYPERMMQDARRSEIASEIGAMDLRVARDDGVNDGDTDAAADVADEIVKAAGVSDLFVAERAHRDGG